MVARGRRWQAAFVVVLFLALVVGAAFTGWWYARESPPHQGPIIVISADGLSTDRLPTYGANRSDTPAIDALAADGVVFDRAYTHSPLTLPSHASMLSGLLPFEHGVRDDVGFTLNESVRTLAESLAARGFDTGAVVSTALLGRDSGIAQGFAFFDAEMPDMGDGRPPAVTRDVEPVGEAAERWMRSRDGQRFFLFVQVDAPDTESILEQLMKQLGELGFYDESTVVLIGDHGPASIEGPLTDSSLRVPFIVKQPSSAGATRRVTQPVQEIDLYPTILDLVRAPVPGGLAGRSLRAVLEKDDETLAERPIYAESLAAFYALGSYPAYGLTSGGHRLVRREQDQLFDLQVGGPALPGDLPEKDALSAALDEMLADHGIEVPADTTDREATVAALGHFPGAALDLVEPVRLERPAEFALMESHRHAAILAGEGRLAAAVGRLRAITRKHPELTLVHFQTGQLLLRVGRVQEAIVEFNLAARQQPDSPALQMTLARAYLRVNDIARATDRARLGVALAERHRPDALAATRDVAARVALAHGDAESATKYAEALQQADPDLPMESFVRGRLLYDQARYEDAIGAFEEADAAGRRHDRTIEDLHLYFGESLARLARYDEAEAQFVEELRRFPQSLTTYSSLVMLHHALNRDEEVERTIQAMIDAVPTPEGYATAARLWTLVGARARAAAVRADARARFRDDSFPPLLDRKK